MWRKHGFHREPDTASEYAISLQTSDAQKLHKCDEMPSCLRASCRESRTHTDAADPSLHFRPRCTATHRLLYAQAPSPARPALVQMRTFYHQSPSSLSPSASSDQRRPISHAGCAVRASRHRAREQVAQALLDGFRRAGLVAVVDLDDTRIDKVLVRPMVSYGHDRRGVRRDE